MSARPFIHLSCDHPGCDAAVANRQRGRRGVRIAVSADEIDLDLLIDTGHVAPGEHACRSDLARHRIPAGRLTIATPRNRTRRQSA